MKTQKFNMLLITAMLLICYTSANAEQVKKVHKSWPAKKVDALTVENKFGNINFINTRDDSVTIDIVVNAEEDGFGSSLANQIDINFSFENGEVTAETVFSGKFKTKYEFSINYTINIPIDKDLNVTNKFGNVNLSDLKANGKFDVSYGSIFGNALKSPDNENIEIELKYGSATFDSANRLKANIAYSKFRIGSIGVSTINSRFSSFNIDNCDQLLSDSQYDNFYIGTIHSLNTDSKFTDWKIEEISDRGEFDTQYGGVKVKHVAKNFKKIRVENGFGNIRIGIDNNASYLLRSETNFCDVKYPKTSPRKYFKEGHRTTIEAVIGEGTPNSEVYIESKYGNVDLME